MDEDARDLMIQLCTRIGMIMEDTSVLALTVGALDQRSDTLVIGKLQLAASKITALADAAEALIAGS